MSRKVEYCQAEDLLVREGFVNALQARADLDNVEGLLIEPKIEEAIRDMGNGFLWAATFGCFGRRIALDNGTVCDVGMCLSKSLKEKLKQDPVDVGLRCLHQSDKNSDLS